MRVYLWWREYATPDRFNVRDVESLGQDAFCLAFCSCIDARLRSGFTAAIGIGFADLTARTILQELDYCTES